MSGSMLCHHDFSICKVFVSWSTDDLYFLWQCSKIVQINYSKWALIVSLPLSLDNRPINRAGSVSEIPLRRSFRRKKIRFVQMRSRAGPVTEISDFATQISVTGMNYFPYEHFSPGDRDQTFFDKIASQSQHSGRNGIIFVWYVFLQQR